MCGCFVLFELRRSSSRVAEHPPPVFQRRHTHTTSLHHPELQQLLKVDWSYRLNDANVYYIRRWHMCMHLPGKRVSASPNCDASPNTPQSQRTFCITARKAASLLSCSIRTALHESCGLAVWGMWSWWGVPLTSFPRERGYNSSFLLTTIWRSVEPRTVMCCTHPDGERPLLTVNLLFEHRL